MNKYKCVCGASFKDIGEARDHEDNCPQMQEALKQKEQWEKHEIEVNDGGGVLKDVFRPDYAKTRELDQGKIKLTNWHWHTVTKTKYILTQEGALQHGVNYIRRRFVIYGASGIEGNHKEKIKIGGESFMKKLEKFNSWETQRMKKGIEIGDTSGERTSLYMEEKDFARIRHLAEIFNLTEDSIERIAFAYSVITLKEYFDPEIIKNAEEDIEEFKEYIDKYLSL